MSQGFNRKFIERTMIVLTDGIQNRGRPARDAASSLAAQGVTIHAITFGNDADQSSMKESLMSARGDSSMPPTEHNFGMCLKKSR